MSLRECILGTRARYRINYTMPRECERDLGARNVRRLMRIVPITLSFGILMTVYTFFTVSPGDGRFWIAVCYYGSYVLISLAALIAIRVLGRRGARIAAQNLVCFIVLMCAQWLCVFQKSISSYPAEGYLVWTIANIVIIALFSFKPIAFFGSMALQFAAIVAFDSGNGMHQFLNLSVLVLVTVILAFTHWKMTIRDFRNVEAIRAANDKSDELLRNILPPKVIDELREKGSSDPELFDQVSILFTDLVDFTAVSSLLPPEYIIGELSDLFSGFDCIIEKYGCTRIKTIGDSYMAVCGLPEPDPDHARKIVQAGLECLEYLSRRNDHSKIKWKMRVGVHSGSVVAGIVGARKYIYDVFGDTVNIASRMESSSNEMRVNVSEETYRRTKDHFSYERREPQRVKGKGMMNMYFADSAREAPSA